MRKAKVKPWVDFYPGFLHLMGDNGWISQFGDRETDYNRYKFTVLNDYEHVIDAIVFEYERHIGFNGTYGVGWLEWMDCNGWDRSDIGFSSSDIQSMEDALEIAEENLVRCGIPFIPDYYFRGKNKAKLKRRNDATRKRLNMERWEKEAKGDDWQHTKVVMK